MTCSLPLRRRWRWSFRSRRTDGALRHTEVSQPATLMCSHVTTWYKKYKSSYVFFLILTWCPRLHTQREEDWSTQMDRRIPLPCSNLPASSRQQKFPCRTSPLRPGTQRGRGWSRREDRWNPRAYRGLPANSQRTSPCHSWVRSEVEISSSARSYLMSVSPHSEGMGGSHSANAWAMKTERTSTAFIFGISVGYWLIEPSRFLA